MQRTATHFKRLLFPSVLLGLFLATGAVHAQYADTFLVSIAEKTPEHPYYNVGHNEGYVVNGKQSPTIILIRDSLYLFDTDSVPSRLTFQFYTNPMGGSQGFYGEHIEEQINSTGIWKIRATDETPDTLYYGSTRQLWVGGMILVVDSLTSSVEEGEYRGTIATHNMQARLSPNPFAEESELRIVLDERSHVRVDILNTLGQVVGTQEVGLVEAGERSVRVDGSALSPGLYLYRVEALSERRRWVATGKMQVVR